MQTVRFGSAPCQPFNGGKVLSHQPMTCQHQRPRKGQNSRNSTNTAPPPARKFPYHPPSGLPRWVHKAPPAPSAPLRAKGAPLRGRGPPVDYPDNPPPTAISPPYIDVPPKKRGFRPAFTVKRSISAADAKGQAATSAAFRNRLMAGATGRRQGRCERTGRARVRVSDNPTRRWPRQHYRDVGGADAPARQPPASITPSQPRACGVADRRPSVG